MGTTLSFILFLCFYSLVDSKHLLNIYELSEKEIPEGSRYIIKVLLAIYNTEECDDTYFMCLSSRKDGYMPTGQLCNIMWRARRGDGDPEVE